ncbi:MAG: type II secretion system F family protein [Planctomycetota bacterium]
MSSRFAYDAIDGTGSRVSGVLRGVDRRDAISRLVRRGEHPTSVVERPLGSTGIKGRVSKMDLAVFTGQLAAVVRAGLPLLAALATIRPQLSNSLLREVVDEIGVSLSEDSVAFADTLSEHPSVFDAVYVGLVHAGEQGGRLPDALDEIAVYLRRSARVQSQVISACVYPSFLLLMGLVAVGALLVFVVPKFEALFESLGGELPLPTRVLLGASSLLTTYWLALLLPVSAAIVLAGWASGRPGTRAFVDAALLRVPGLRSLVTKLETARVARTLGSLLNGGVAVVSALTTTAGAARNTVFQRAINAAARSVEQGGTIHEGMAASGVFPNLMLSLTRTGEGSGDLPGMLSQISEIYDEETELALSNLVKLLEPVLITLIGIVVAGIVASVMLPVFQSSEIVG